jgi:hypothetical protein
MSTDDTHDDVDAQPRTFGNRDDSAKFGLQRGEAAAAVAAGTVAVVVGLWAGLWMIPDAALAVPTETLPNGDVTAKYQPVPSALPVLSAVVAAVGGWATWTVMRTEQRVDGEHVEEGATDG